MKTSCKCSLPVNQGNSLRPWCFTSPVTVWLIKHGERGGGGGGQGRVPTSLTTVKSYYCRKFFGSMSRKETNSSKLTFQCVCYLK